jgi:hypothetical protein
MEIKMNLQKYFQPKLPMSQQEINDRGYSVAQIQSDVLTSFYNDTISQDELNNLAPLMRVVGMPREFCEDIISYWHDESKQEQILAIVFHTDAGKEFFDTLSDIDRARTAGPWVRPMMLLADQGELFPKHALAALWQSTSEEAKPTLIDTMEKARLEMMAGTHVYEQCWRFTDFAIPF